MKTNKQLLVCPIKNKNNSQRKLIVRGLLIGIVITLFIFPLVNMQNSGFSVEQTERSNGFSVSKPIENPLFSVNGILFDETVSFANLYNSSHARMVYNPRTDRISISWVDLIQPDTPAATSSINYLAGNRTQGWSSRVTVVSVLDTMKQGYNPVVDENETAHMVYEAFSAGQYDLKDIQIKDDTSIQSAISISNNAGNSTKPVTLSDQKGIIHLVWIDSTNNTNGDLFYSNYNHTRGNWLAPTAITTTGNVVEESVPSLTVDYNNTIHLVWADSKGADQELYYAYLEEGGTWSSDEKITDLVAAPIDPVITANNVTQKIELLFRDNGTTDNLYYTAGDFKSTISSWLAPAVITPHVTPESDFGIASDIYGTTAIVYEYQFIGTNRIYLQQKVAASSSWTPEQIISTSGIPAYDPAIVAAEEGTFYIAYSEVVDGTRAEIFLKYGKIDSDGDLLPDYDEEFIYFTDPLDVDSDDDQLSDGEEVLTYGTNPLSNDTDNDQMPDAFEVTNGFDPTDNSDAVLDPDSDNLTNLEEFNEGTNPLLDDSDGDGLLDGDEVKIYNTNPLSDDTDSDGLYDGYEVTFGLNPLVEDDKEADPDQDGLTTEFEQAILTDPTNPDTDGDGWSDGQEVSKGTDPLDPNDFPVVQNARDYTRLITGIIIGVGSAVIIVILALLVTNQFKPRKSRKQKELEIEEKVLFTESEEKGTKLSWEAQERAKLEAAAKKRMEQPESAPPINEKGEYVDIRDRIREPKKDLPKDTADFKRIGKRKTPKKDEDESKAELVEQTPIITEKTRKPIDRRKLAEKKEQIVEIISTLRGYETKLKDLRGNKMSVTALSKVDREALTEYAAESQSLYSEAKALWNTSVLQIIKGFEDEMHTDTLVAERILDNCEMLANEILDILVNRELEFSDDEEKKEDIRRKAQRAIAQSETEEKDEEKKNDQKD